MSARLTHIRTALDALAADIDKAVAQRQDDIDAVHSSYRSEAENLVAYLALRSADRRTLQHELATLGAPSLQFPELDVRAKIAAARTLVSALIGDEPQAVTMDEIDGVEEKLQAAEQRLMENADETLGVASQGRSTRIMVTLPREAAQDPQIVEDVFGAGAEIARINLVYGDVSEWQQMAEHVEDTARRLNRIIPIAVDLPGPKIFTGRVADGPRVGASLVSRYDDGEMRYPARLWLVPENQPEGLTEPPHVEGIAPLCMMVDATWFASLEVGTEVRTADNRGVKRTFVVVAKQDEGALLQGDRSTWIRNHAMLEANFMRTRVRGIPPLQRGIHLERGDELILTDDLTPVNPPRDGEVARIGCTEPRIFSALQVGDPVLFNNGALYSTVQNLGDGEARLLITQAKDGGQTIYENCGINVPGTALNLPAVTAEDEKLLEATVSFASLVEVSFVRTAQDMRDAVAMVRRVEQRSGRNVGIVVKLETLESMQNLPDILLELMKHERVGVMVARGDMAAELGIMHMVEAPRYVVNLCQAAQLPVIIGSNILETLTDAGQPTRAEVTDAAWAQQAECVMLNHGKHMVETVEAVGALLSAMDGVQRKNQSLLPSLHEWKR